MKYGWILRGTLWGLLMFLILDIILPYLDKSPIDSVPKILYSLALWIGIGIVSERLFPIIKDKFRP